MEKPQSVAARKFDMSGHATTRYGKFRVRVKSLLTRGLETREEIVSGYSIHVGGASTDCVYITVPLTGSVGTLVRLDSMEGCALDPPYTVGGKRTIEMTRLAFSILMDLFKHIKTLELDDSASFSCKLPDGKQYPLNMTEYELFFHQSAYYESRFGAKLINPELRRMYEDVKTAFNDPSRKPSTFDFKVPALQIMLEPLYKESTTWKDFADKIDTLYRTKEDSRKCAAAYIWLKAALLVIGNNISYSGHKWEIELNTAKHKIPYKAIPVYSGGGYTRRINRQKAIQLGPPRPQEYLEMDWSRVISRPFKA